MVDTTHLLLPLLLNNVEAAHAINHHHLLNSLVVVEAPIKDVGNSSHSNLVEGQDTAIKDANQTHLLLTLRYVPSRGSSVPHVRLETV